MHESFPAGFVLEFCRDLSGDVSSRRVTQLACVWRSMTSSRPVTPERCGEFAHQGSEAGPTFVRPSPTRPKEPSSCTLSWTSPRRASFQIVASGIEDAEQRIVFSGRGRVVRLPIFQAS